MQSAKETHFIRMVILDFLSAALARMTLGNRERPGETRLPSAETVVRKATEQTQSRSGSRMGPIKSGFLAEASRAGSAGIALRGYAEMSRV